MTKKRISLTIEEDLVDRVDELASRQELNRSQTVEDIFDEYFEATGLNTAVVLCGDPELKSLDLYKGKSVLAHILEHLSSQNIKRVILLAGRNKERVQKEFGQNYEGLSIEYREEDSPQGTAAALKKVESELNQTFALLNGHVITDVDLDEMLRTHRSTDATATMALTTVEDPSRYGVARLKGQKVLGFEEKPKSGDEPSRLINAGTYILEPEIFGLIDQRNLENVFESLASTGDLAGYIYGGSWIDIDDN